MDLQLEGKTALVTGSTAGIGLAIASALAGEGARVIVNGRTQKRVHDAMGTISAAHPGARRPPDRQCSAVAASSKPAPSASARPSFARSAAALG